MQLARNRNFAIQAYTYILQRNPIIVITFETYGKENYKDFFLHWRLKKKKPLTRKLQKSQPL